MHQSTSRFSDRVDNYIKYRPGYPAAMMDYLLQEFGLQRAIQIADIGSGTGLSAIPFLDLGFNVVGVEPNKEMREAAEKILQRYPRFSSVAGSAEDTNLAACSIDFIMAGQAFHWFDVPAFKKECTRIGSEKAYCALVWNERLENSDFLKDYEALIQNYATDYNEINHKLVSLEQISDFYAPENFVQQTFENEQVFDFAGLRGRLESASYIISKSHERYETMIIDLEKLFNRYKEAGKVKIAYETKLYLGKVSRYNKIL